MGSIRRSARRRLIVLIAGSFAVELWLSQPALVAWRRVHSPDGDPSRSQHAVHRHRHSGRDGDAAQSVSPFVDRPDPQVPRYHREPARGDSIRLDRFGGRADVRALHQRRNPHHAAATFHGTGHQDVAEIGDAYQLLSPLLGTTMASVLFAVALLCSGQNATLTGTLAGQIVMEGSSICGSVRGCGVW